MAVLLADSLGISEVRLPRQSVGALMSESEDCAKMYLCIGRTACFKQ